MTSTCLYGGSPYPPQEQKLRRGIHIIVGTPGRVQDHIDRGTLKMQKLRCGPQPSLLPPSDLHVAVLAVAHVPPMMHPQNTQLHTVVHTDTGAAALTYLSMVSYTPSPCIHFYIQRFIRLTDAHARPSCQRSTPASLYGHTHPHTTLAFMPAQQPTLQQPHLPGPRRPAETHASMRAGCASWTSATRCSTWALRTAWRRSLRPRRTRRACRRCCSPRRCRRG